MPKLVFALHQSGRVLHVADVESGLACQCTCLDCKEPLVARKGPVLEHHFGHTSGQEHDWAWETHLHAYAKQLIIDAGGLTVPLHETVARHLGFPAEQPAGHLKACDVPIQQEVSRGPVRPDLVLQLDEHDIEIALEVRVTHGCEQTKRDEFKRQRLAALEIDLRRFPPQRFDPKKLADAVLHKTENKHWLWPLPPRPARAWTPLPDEPISAESEQPPAKPRLPRKPLPAPSTLAFEVRAWNATVTVSVEHSGEEHICVRVVELAIGRMASTNAEQAAPRIADLVGYVVNMHTMYAENPRAGTWLVPSWHASAVVNGLQEECLRYRAQEFEQRKAQAATLEADLRIQRRPVSGQRSAPSRPEPPTDSRNNPYARRRG